MGTIVLGATKKTTSSGGLLSSVKKTASKALTSYFTKTPIGKLQKKGLDIETAIVSHPVTAVTKGVPAAVKQFKETKTSTNVKNILLTTGSAAAATVAAPYIASTAAGGAALKTVGASVASGALTLGSLAVFAPETTKKVLSSESGRAVAAAGLLGGPVAGVVAGVEQGTGFISESLGGLSDTAKTALTAAGLTAAAGAAALAISPTARSAAGAVLSAINPFGSSGNGENKAIGTTPSTIPQASTPATVTPISSPVIAEPVEKAATNTMIPNIKITNKPIINVAIAR